jgi:predicted membrane protein
MKMNHKKLIWGVILILVGILFILKTTGVLYFNWYHIIYLWPLLLVFWGISILPVKGLPKFLLSILVVVAGIFIMYKYNGEDWYEYRSPWRYYHKEYRDKEPDWDKSENEKQNLIFPYDPEIQSAVLKLDAAAGSFELKKTTTELIEVNNEGNIGKYSLTTHESDDIHIINLSMEKVSKQVFKMKHKVDIKLNENPLWEMDMNIGAASVDMDLSGFKTKNIKISGGASSVLLKTGDLYPQTTIDIDAAASSITIYVPAESGCRIQTSAVLSGRKMKDFKKTENNDYVTDNYEDSENKVFIIVDVAVSSIEVIRY